MSKSFFIDTTLCTACRGCQVACKQWNKLPATKTKNVGSYQNPQDLSYSTFKLVRFKESLASGKLSWLFFAEQCRHCVEPPCKSVADDYDPRAVVVDPETGAVIFTEHSAKLKDIDEGSEMCPYNIPRKDPATGLWTKCTMCVDRVANGLLPACVQVCPTGCMNFGDREDMRLMAQKRLDEVRKEHPKATLGDAEDVRTIYLFAEAPSQYHEYAVASAERPGMNRKQLLARVMSPVRSTLS